MKRAFSITCLLAALLAATETSFGQTDRTYTYDAAGNRTSATNQIRFTGVDAFTVQPERATGGDRVNIYGRNFDYTQPGQFGVTFGGVAGTVVTVAPRVVTCDVPLGALTGDVVLSLPGGGNLTVATLVIAGISLSPDVAEVTFGEQVQFTATVQGAANMAVDWEVNGIPGGNAAVGTIDAGGLYTTPDGASADPFPFLIRASNSRIQQSAYAVVKPGCTNGNPIGDEQFELGNAATVNQRDCWEFNGNAWETIYVAAISDAGSLFRLSLRDSSGALLAISGPGQRLKLANVILTQDDIYRIEVEAGASPAGSYRIWVDRFDVYPDGRWMFPGDEFWDDPNNWSNSVTPNEIDDVFIPDYPGDNTIMTAGNTLAGSVLCRENLSLQSGELSVTGGTITVDGTFTLNGGALANSEVLAGAGGFGLTVTSNSNNALRNVTLNDDLNLDVNQARVRIKDLTLNGSVHLAATGASLGFEGDNFWQTGDIFFEAPSGTSYLSMQTGGTLVIGPGVTISGARGNIGGAFWWNASMTLVNQGIIRSAVAAGTITVTATETQNEGLLEAVNGAELIVNGLTGPLGNTNLADAGSELTLNGPGYDNTRTLLAPASTALTLDGTWTNSGVIDAVSSTVNLCGSFTTASMGAVNNTSASVNFCGDLDNSAGTLTLDGASGGVWNLAGGSITGGIVDLTGGAALRVLANSNNRLDGCELNGNVRFDVSSARAQWHDVVHTGTVFMAGSSAAIGFDGDQTFDGDLVFEGSSSQYLNMFSPGKLTFASGSTVSGSNGRIGQAVWWSGAMTVDNDGVIAADVDARTITIFSPFTNNGTIEATDGGNLVLSDLAGDLGVALLDGAASDLDVTGSGWTNNVGVSATGGSTLTFDGTWTNAGGITAIDSTVNLCGSFTTSDIGTVANTNSAILLCGALNNTSGVFLLDGSTGTWTLQGGSITNGTVDLTGGAYLNIGTNSSNRLDGCTINGDLRFDANSSRTQWNDVTLNGTAFMAGSSAAIGFDGDQTWASGSLVFEGSSTQYLNMLNPGTLTLAPGRTFSGSNGNIGQAVWWSGAMGFDNQGTVTSNVDARTITVVAAMTSSGTLEALGGGNMTVSNFAGNLGNVLVDGASSDMSVTGTWTNDLGVTATNGASFTGGGTWANDGSLTATDSTLTLNGSWTNAGGIAATNSTVNICGALVTSTLGSITNTNSTINLCAAVDNTGATLTLDGGTGTWTLLGGSITNGTVDLTGGTYLNIGTNSSNRLDGCTINGDLRFDASSARTQWNDVTLNGTAFMTGSSAAIGFDGDQTWASGSLVFEGSSTQYLNMLNPGTLTLAPGRTFSGSNGNIGQAVWWSGAMGFDNQGTVTSNVNARTITVVAAMTSSGTLEALGGGNMTLSNFAGNLGNVLVDGASSDMSVTGTWTNDLGVTATNGGSFTGGGTWANDGSLTATDSTLTLNGSWTNTGGIAATNSTVNICGTLVTSTLGSITNTNSTINLCAAVDNTGATLTLDGGTGTWTLLGGSILNGTVDLTGGTYLNIGGNTSNRLDGCTINGDLRFDGSSSRTQWNDVTLNGTAFMTGSSAAIGFDGDQTWASGSLVFEGSSTQYLNMLNPGTLTLAPGRTFSGSNGNIGQAVWWSGAMGFDNQGTVTSNVDARTITVVAAMTSSGTLEALGGGNMTVSNFAGNLGNVLVDGASSDMSVTGTWTNNLGVTATNGASFTGGGTWANDGGLTATDSTLTLNGSWTNAGGIAATNSTVNICGALVTSTLGSITNTNSTINLCAAVDNTGATLTLDGGTGTWTLLGGSITNGTVDLTGGTYLNIGGNTSNRLDGCTINGDLRFDASSARTQWNDVTLNGTAFMAGSSSTIGFDGDQTLNSGATLLFEGTSNKYLNMTSAGSLTVASGASVQGHRGNIGQAVWWSAAMTSFINQGSVAPGESAAGLITVATNYVQTASGSLEMELGGTSTSQFDRLVVSGAATFDGALNLSLINAFTPALNDTFDVITHGGSSGTFTLTGADLGGGLELDPTYGANALTLTVVPGP